MKSKDFIKMIQEEDPTGEHHVRITGDGGHPTHAVLKEGYWDGSYTYLDEKENLVISDKDAKLDIYTEDLEDFLWSSHGNEEKVVIDVSGKDRIESLKASIKEMAKKANDYHQQSLEKFTFKIISKIQEGWRIVQPKTSLIGHYNVMWFIKDPSKFEKNKSSGLRISNKNQQIMCQGDCAAVLESGFFKHVELENVIEWVFTSNAVEAYHKTNE